MGKMDASSTSRLKDKLAGRAKNPSPTRSLNQLADIAAHTAAETTWPHNLVSIDHLVGVPNHDDFGVGLKSGRHARHLLVVPVIVGV